MNTIELPFPIEEIDVELVAGFESEEPELKVENLRVFSSATCGVCQQVLLPIWSYCPACGTKLL